MPHLDACPWGGAYFPPGIWLNGRHDRHVIAHELGHTYGVSEEGSAWICDPGCHAQPYMNPFSVMGHGWSDFGAWEKHQFGWLDRIAEPAPRLTLGAIDRPSTSPQALRVLAAGDEYWFEYRPAAPVWAYESDDAAPGVVIHAGSNGLGEPSRYSGRNFLLYDPVGRGRPSAQPGETLSVRGAFAIRVESAGPDSVELAFRWTDRTRPARPRILSARIRRGRMFVRWRRGLERGSGVAIHEVFVDGRRAGRVPSVRTVANLLVTTDDTLAVRVARGRHRVQVVAVDRAGNRSRPAVRIVRSCSFQGCRRIRRVPTWCVYAPRRPRRPASPPCARSRRARACRRRCGGGAGPHGASRARLAGERRADPAESCHVRLARRVAPAACLGHRAGEPPLRVRPGHDPAGVHDHPDLPDDRPELLDDTPAERDLLRPLLLAGDAHRSPAGVERHPPAQRDRARATSSIAPGPPFARSPVRPAAGGVRSSSPGSRTTPARRVWTRS